MLLISIRYRAGQFRIMSQNNILHEVAGELRTISAIFFLGGHRMALGCFGLHANGCFNACRNCPVPKNLCQNSPALPYFVTVHYHPKHNVEYD